MNIWEGRKEKKERRTQAEGEAGSMQGARCGTRFWVSRIMPWAEGSAKPLGHPGCPIHVLQIPDIINDETFRKGSKVT